MGAHSKFAECISTICNLSSPPTCKGLGAGDCINPGGTEGKEKKRGSGEEEEKWRIDQRHSTHKYPLIINIALQDKYWTDLNWTFYLAGVELDESLLPKMALYCGGPPGGAESKYSTGTPSPSGL